MLTFQFLNHGRFSTSTQLINPQFFLTKPLYPFVIQAGIKQYSSDEMSYSLKEVVSKETVVLHQWGSSTRNLSVLSTELINVN